MDPRFAKKKKAWKIDRVGLTGVSQIVQIEPHRYRDPPELF